MSSTFHAQEIEDNQINENKEALLRKKSPQNGTYENATKRDLNMETTNLISGVNGNSSNFLPTNDFSYTKNCNITNKIKPPLFPKPKDRLLVNFNAIVNLAGNMQHSEVKIDSINNDFLISNDCQRIDDPNDSSKNKEEYIRLEDTKIGSPPLPSRPPPVFKYPLGTFSKEEQDLKKAQNKFCPSDRMKKIINLNDEISGIVLDDQGNKPMTEFDVGVKYDICKNFSPNSLGIQKKLMKASVETEEIKKPIAGREANKFTRKAPGVSQKIPKSISLESHKNKPPQPLPRPELHIKKESENSFFPNKSSRIQLEISNPVLDLERNAEFASNLKGFKKTKPSVPCKALFHQRLEKVLVEQRIREYGCPNSANRLKQPLEERLNDDNWRGINESTIQKNKSPARKMSLENSNTSKIDESFISNFENSLDSKIENIGAAPTSAEQRDKQDKMDLKQDHIPDFHSLDRPTLPQKLKSTQRSLSYTSLMQTVKDISTTIWNPSDKSKRSSTGTTIKAAEMVTNSSKTVNSAPDDNFLEIQRSFEEEKDAIVGSSWFHDVSATEAQHRLLKLDQDGAFLIRPTSHPTDRIQYTASITYAGRVFNIHIRRKSNYYLGKEGEKSFQRLSDLIKHYQDVPFDIHPAGSSNPHGICFRVTPPH